MVETLFIAQYIELYKAGIKTKQSKKGEQHDIALYIISSTSTLVLAPP